MPTSQLELTGPGARIITLLNNINELIVRSNDRQAARDVMRAVRVYARNKKYQVPADKIENFLSVLLDSKPSTLSCLVYDIVDDIVIADKAIRYDRKHHKDIES
jgi:hypothetical protein